MNDIKEMNIYEKMSNARVLIQEEGIKKNGKNAFAKYDYWKLADINPVINKALKECRLCSLFQVSEQIAILTIINTDNPKEELNFSIPFIDAEMSKVSQIQSFGASMSYLQRYLILEAFQIGESEIDIDSTEVSESRDIQTSPKGNSDLEKVKKEVQTLCRSKSETKRVEVQAIIKKYNDGSIAVTKVEDINILLKIKEEVEKL